jgi:hypothetical protein
MMIRKSTFTMRLDRSTTCLLGCILALSGCDRPIDPAHEGASPHAEVEVGPNGGLVVEVGPRANAEVVVRDGAQLDIYFLDEELTQPVAVESAILEGFGVVADQGPIPTRLRLARVSDTEPSHFHTLLPAEWSGKRAAVVFPKIIIAGQRRHFDFEVDIPLHPASNASSGEADSQDHTTNDDTPPAGTE